MIRLPRGTAQGLLAYEMGVQKRKDKLKEKIAKRKFELQKLAISMKGSRSGGVSRSEESEYLRNMATLKFKLKGVEGSEAFMQNLANDPSISGPILDYINKIEEIKRKNLEGDEMTPQEILDLGAIIKLKDPEILGHFLNSGDLSEAMNKVNLADDEEFLKLYGLMQGGYKRKGSGVSVFVPTGGMPLPALDEGQLKYQRETFVENFANKLTELDIDLTMYDGFKEMVKKRGFTAAFSLIDKQFGEGTSTQIANEVYQEFREGSNPLMKLLDKNPVISPLITIDLPEPIVKKTDTKTKPIEKSGMYFDEKTGVYKFGTNPNLVVSNPYDPLEFDRLSGIGKDKDLQATFSGSE
tara:strand:+ start:1560 stop:2618 length:1059 start_codon:yes stop_codon:yes gene_type:complete